MADVPLTREEVIALVRDARVWIGKGDNDWVAIGPVADGRALRDALLRLLEATPVQEVTSPPDSRTEQKLDAEVKEAREVMTRLLRGLRPGDELRREAERRGWRRRV